ncbi:hypothetical protein BQ8420_10475 [Nocardiopsis sp. JB363]|nr:hypothetical protein BQ8420_10475 [Nocardiopsis sp. JB363]
MDEYRVALALHPNVWHGHGTWQVRAWLAEAERAGLRVLPPRQGWQAALVAADHVIGDHGSVTFYGAAQGTHTMLATFPHHEMAGGSPIAGFGRAATRLRTDRPLLPQILNDAADHTPDRFASFTDQLNSVPGGSGQILRATLYQLLDLPEPAHPVRVLPPDPPIPYRLEWPRSAQTAPLLATAVNEGPAVRVSRHPEVLVPGGSPALYRPHLVVREDEPDPRARDRADLVICEEGEATVWERLRAALERNRQSALAAAPEGDTCLLLTRDGLHYQLTPQEPFADPEVLASAFWRVRVDHDFAPPALVFTVRVGESSINVHVRPLDRMKRSSADHDNRCPAPGHVPRS